MSAIGSYEILSRDGFASSVARAREIRSESTGTWIFKSTRVVGVEEFADTWRAATRRRVDFDHSGYVLGNYLDAQEAVNGVRLFDEQSEVAAALCRAFTAAFVFDAPVALPALPYAELESFCRTEYEDDASGDGGCDLDGACVLPARARRDRRRQPGRLRDQTGSSSIRSRSTLI
jgi:hypothetical protein